MINTSLQPWRQAIQSAGSTPNAKIHSGLTGASASPDSGSGTILGPGRWSPRPASTSTSATRFRESASNAAPTSGDLTDATADQGPKS